MCLGPGEITSLCGDSHGKTQTEVQASEPTIMHPRGVSKLSSSLLSQGRLACWTAKGTTPSCEPPTGGGW